MRNQLFSLLSSLLVVVTAITPATAALLPSDGAVVTGRVVDQNNAVVSRATVTLNSKSTRFERAVTTDENGSFRFEDLSRSDYSLRATADGFGTTEQAFKLAPGESRAVDLVLTPKIVAEVAVVAASHLVGTPEVVERTPGSIDIIDPKTLENSRVFNFSEALRKVPGVNVRDEEGFGLRPNIGIRGLNPTRSTKVLLLEDGLPLTYAPYGDNASYYHPPVERFESIEVLKGSGQILYGPTTVGGVVNYLTPNPPDRPSGFIKLIGGNRDYFNGHIAYGGTWNKTGLLFNYTRKQGEGARENVRSGLNDFNFKAVQSLTSNQALTMKFSYYGEDSNVAYSGLTEAEYQANPRGNIFRNDFFYGDRFGASATHSLVFGGDTVLTTNFYGAFFKRHWWRQSSNSRERPNRLSTLPGGDPDCLSLADLSTTCGNQGRLRQYYFWGIEPRLQTNYTIGNVRSTADFGFRVHFENQDRRQENGDLPNSRDGVLVEHNRRENQAYSAFVQNRFLFGDLAVTPGVRVEHVKFERTNRLLNVTGKTDLTQVVPGLGVSYRLPRSTTVFVGAHRGFAPPRTEDVINNTTGGTVELDPELSWNYEAGVRTQPHPGVQLEGTFFRMDYENQIVPASLAGGAGSLLTNGGETLHQGIEFFGQIDAGTILRSRHNVYLRSAYTYLPVAEFTGTRFSNISGFNNVSITGNRLPYAPENLLTASVGYANPVGLDAFVEAVYVGRQFTDDLNTINPTADGQRGLIPSYTVWNATGNYRVEKWRTTLFVTVKNLFDRTYIVDRARGLLPGSPRLAQAGVKFNF